MTARDDRSGSHGRREPYRWTGPVDELDPDGDRREPGFPDEYVILPDQTSDDTDAGWGERRWGNEDRLREERPPHWE